MPPPPLAGRVGLAVALPALPSPSPAAAKQAAGAPQIAQAAVMAATTAGKSPIALAATQLHLDHLSLCNGCNCDLADPDTAPPELEVPCADCDCGLAEQLEARAATASTRTSTSRPTTAPSTAPSTAAATAAVASKRSTELNWTPGSRKRAMPSSAERADTLLKELRLSAETAPSARSVGPIAPASSGTTTPAPGCNACPQCDDVCGDAVCGSCRTKLERIAEGLASKRCDKPVFTMCQVARHASADDCWLVARGIVYNVTPWLALGKHPGGNQSILRKAGTDVTKDFKFHSKQGRGIWRELVIGRVARCRKEPCPRKLFSW